MSMCEYIALCMILPYDGVGCHFLLLRVYELFISSRFCLFIGIGMYHLFSGWSPVYRLKRTLSCLASLFGNISCILSTELALPVRRELRHFKGFLGFPLRQWNWLSRCSEVIHSVRCTVAGGWCWFVVRKKYCWWLLAGAGLVWEKNTVGWMQRTDWIEMGKYQSLGIGYFYYLQQPGFVFSYPETFATLSFAFLCGTVPALGNTCADQLYLLDV